MPPEHNLGPKDARIGSMEDSEHQKVSFSAQTVLQRPPATKNAPNPAQKGDTGSLQRKKKGLLRKGTGLGIYREKN